MTARSVALLIAILGTAACGDPPERPTDDRATAGALGSGVTATPRADSLRDSLPAHPDSAPAMPGVRFDPATIREGDVVAGLRVGRVDVTDAGSDFGWVGTVRFLGEMTISGEKRPHHDFPEITTVCMNVDSTSAAKLPRWPNDSRTLSWLCFENQEDAIRMLGPSTAAREPITVVIDVYQTPRQFSDVYNTARLVRVVTRGSVTTPPP